MNFSLNPVQLVFSAVCGALAIALGYLVLAPLPEISVPPAQARAAPVDDDTPLPRFEAPSKAAFAEVDDRSVFNPTRVRVASSSVPGATNSATLPSDLSLVGIILDDNKKLALFKSPQAPLAIGIGIGGSIEGWQVTRVEPDRVALRAGGPEQEMKLSDNKPASGGAAGNGPNGGPQFGPNLRRQFQQQPNFPRPGMNNPNNNANGNNGSNNNANNNNNNSDDDDNN
jgi:hypothetical protein